MPRGAPKRVFTFRLAPELIEAVQRYTDNATDAVEEGLALWLKRARRKASADPLAKDLTPPSARERAVRGAGRAA